MAGANALELPGDQMVGRIRAAYDRTQQGQREWVAGTLELAALLAEARERFPANREFHYWLSAKCEFLTPDNRAALIGLGQNIELARRTLMQTQSFSWRLIWREMQDKIHPERAERRLRNAAKTDEVVKDAPPRFMERKGESAAAKLWVLRWDTPDGEGYEQFDSEADAREHLLGYCADAWGWARDMPDDEHLIEEYFKLIEGSWSITLEDADAAPPDDDELEPAAVPARREKEFRVDARITQAGEEDEDGGTKLFGLVIALDADEAANIAGAYIREHSLQHGEGYQIDSVRELGEIIPDDEIDFDLRVPPPRIESPPAPMERASPGAGKYKLVRMGDGQRDNDPEAFAVVTRDMLPRNLVLPPLSFARSAFKIVGQDDKVVQLIMGNDDEALTRAARGVLEKLVRETAPSPRIEPQVRPEFARKVIAHYGVRGKCLDPCWGTNGGGFHDALPEPDRHWCEISRGIDFYDWTEPVDWCVGNAPWGEEFRDFAKHAFDINAENVLFLLRADVALNTWARLDDWRERGYGLKAPIIRVKWEHAFVDMQRGFTLGLFHWQRGFTSDVLTFWD
jgi:hypothetical protein